jgi:hypothetical protein
MVNWLRKSHHLLPEEGVKFVPATKANMCLGKHQRDNRPETGYPTIFSTCVQRTKDGWLETLPATTNNKKVGRTNKEMDQYRSSQFVATYLPENGTRWNCRC